MTTRPRTSGLAIVAAASSCVFCLPIGLVLGVLALVRIHKSKGRLTGRGLAVASVAVSLLLNSLTLVFMTQVYPVLMRNSECVAQQLLVARELDRIQSLQRRFQKQQHRYGTLAEIGYRPSSEGDAYGYKVIDHDAEHFVVAATAHREGMGGDRWELDETGIPRNVHSGCIQ